MVTSVRLPDELERAVLAYAERHDVSKSTAMRLLMENGLAREDLARDVTDLEDRLTAMEDTLSEVADAVERIQTAVVDESGADSAVDATTPAEATGLTADVESPTSVPTIPGGPDAPPQRAPTATDGASDGATEQVAIGQWNEGDQSTAEEVTDGGRPTEPRPAERS